MLEMQMTAGEKDLKMKIINLEKNFEQLITMYHSAST